MGNEIVEIKNISTRKKLYKKAAVLAAIATITGVASTAHQKAEKSEAILGAIIAVATTLISVGSGVAGSVQQSKAQAEQERLEREERERLEREEKERLAREAEEQRIAEALRNPENDVRLQEKLDQESRQNEAGKVINMNIADNTNLAEEIEQQSTSSRANGILNRPVSPPKDIQVGGFGVDVDEDEEEDIEAVEQVVYESVDVEDTEYLEEDEEVALNDSDDIYEDDLVEDEESDSNIVRFSLNDLKIGDEENDEQLSELITQTESEDAYAELDLSALMSQEDAMNHELVQSGLLSAEDVILLDFGIRNGSINEEVINGMYEQGLITDGYYEGAYYLMESIYGEYVEYAEDAYEEQAEEIEDVEYVEETEDVYDEVEQEVEDEFGEEGFGI